MTADLWFALITAGILPASMTADLWSALMTAGILPASMTADLWSALMTAGIHARIDDGGPLVRIDVRRHSARISYFRFQIEIGRFEIEKWSMTQGALNLMVR
jgi:hypothetical protein